MSLIIYHSNSNISNKSESKMKSYVTKKENLCLFKTDGEKQGNMCFIRRESHTEIGKSTDTAFSSLLREFRGEIVNGDKMILFSVENGFF